MIVFMKNGDMDLARDVANASDEVDVQVSVAKANRPIILALLSLAADRLNLAEIEKMPGVDRCERGNDYFNDHWEDFEESWAVFGWGH